MPRNNHSPDRKRTLDVAASARAQLALDLRIRGFEWDEIARQAGFKSRGAAHYAAHRLLGRQESEKAEHYRAILTKRMEKLHIVYFAGAMGGEKYIDRDGNERTARPNPEAANICLQLYDRMMKLHGLDKDAGQGGTTEVKVIVQGGAHADTAN